jgi:putative Holliday junction resolvase
MTKSIDSHNLAQISTILGIDFGEAKIGLAVADSETKMAFARGALANDGNFLEKLAEIVSEENVEMIIVGIVSHAKDPKSFDAKKKFGKLIEKEIKVKIAYQDEMFTTKMAQANLIAKGMKNVGKIDDAESARIILQSWLDENSLKKS